MVIEVGQKDEAECVAQALKTFGSELVNRRGRWGVVVPDDFQPIALLAALEDCLRDESIPSVMVSVADQNFVMEGSSS
jgi:hypothetical protein